MHKLPDLPYGYDALEPFIDEETMRIHHTKHHQAYVDKLNVALEEYPNLQKLSINSLLSDLSVIPENIRQSVVNNGGGHYNHDFFWKIMAPPSESRFPDSGPLFDIVKNSFESVDNLKKLFIEKAMSVFGSGWVFLIVDKEKNLSLKRHSFQNTPISSGNTPLMCVDLWEHAYYLKYQNRRNEYLEAWWNVINWTQVENNLKKII